MNAQQQPEKQVTPSLDEMREALFSLRTFLNSRGGQYLANVYQAQAKAHQDAVNASPEAVDEMVHPVKYILTQEYKKGVQQGLVLALQMPRLLLEKLEADVAQAERVVVK